MGIKSKCVTMELKSINPQQRVSAKMSEFFFFLQSAEKDYSVAIKLILNEEIEEDIETVESASNEELPQENQEVIKPVPNGEPAQQNNEAVFSKPVPKVKLNGDSIKGSGLSVEAGLKVVKSEKGDCCVSALDPLKVGTHSWNIKLSEKYSWSTDCWILVGVHTDPLGAKTGLKEDPALYGLSCSEKQVNCSHWNVFGGTTTYPSELKRLINPGDEIEIVLDCDAHKITFNHKNWQETIGQLPEGVNFYPFFAPYDLGFSLIG